MRRKDREITDSDKINEIISSCFCCRLGFCDSGTAYIVPLSFGFAEKSGVRTFYFHSAKEGRKIDLIKKNPAVGFELDTGYRIKEGNTACSCTAGFQSVIGNGSVSFVTDQTEKEEALREIMKQNTGRKDWEFVPAAVNSVCIFKLEVSEMSCKEHE